MRQIPLVKVLALCCLLLISCKKEENPIDLLVVSDDFSSTITINSSSFINDDGSFSSNAILDITSNEVIAEHQNFIIDSRVNKLSYEIVNFSGNPQTVISNAALQVGGTRIDIGDLIIEDNVNIENHVLDPYLLNRIAYDIRNLVTVNTSLSGELNDNTVNFNLIIRTNLTVGIDDLQ